MKFLLTRWLPQSGSSPSLPDEELPRYPPFAKGLPAASVARVLATQTALLDGLRHSLALPDETFDAIVAPVVERYAAFTHLLPASEAHHHRGAGGLFRHGLEVAHWAALASEAIVFATAATPRARKSEEPRWRVAICVAGLLHDIGKPVSDLAVVNRAGSAEWNPYLDTLSDWTRRHGIDRYFLRWREQRHQRHEQFSALVAQRLLTGDCLSYLAQFGPEILATMLAAIAGSDTGGIVRRLVVDADRKSVERDLKVHQVSADLGLGVPVEKYLLDAMRRLIGNGTWIANQPGARLWRFTDGVYVVWKTAAQEIVDVLGRDHVPGIPRDPDTLADILIERDLAVPRRATGDRAYRYWRIVPSGLDSALYLLRLASPELLYPGEPPIAIAGRNVDEPAGEGGVEGGEAMLAITANVAPQRPDAGADLPVPQEPIRSRRHRSGPTNTVHAARSPSSGPVASASATTADASADMSVDASEQQTGEAVASTASGPAANPALPAVTVSPTRPEDDPQAAAWAWLATQGEAGAVLTTLAEHCRARPLSGLDTRDDRLWLPYPDVALACGVEAPAFLQTIQAAGWIEPDWRAPLRTIRERDGVRGLWLTAAVSRRLNGLFAADGAIAANAVKVTMPEAEENPERARTPPARRSTTRKRVPPPAPTAAPVSQPTAAGSVEDLIARIRCGHDLPVAVSEASGWLSISATVIDWYASAVPGLTRAKLIIGLHRHADCRLDEPGVLKVRSEAE